MHTCPNCNSSDIKKFSVAYAEGTTLGTSNYKEKYIFSSTYSYGEGKTKGKSNSQSQTKLAKRCSPPKRPYPNRYFHIFAIILGFIILGNIDDLITSNIQIRNMFDTLIEKFHIHKLLLTLIFLIFSISIVYILRYFLWSKKLWKKYRKNKVDYPKSWICLSCGQDFLIT